MLLLLAAGLRMGGGVTIVPHPECVHLRAVWQPTVNLAAVSQPTVNLSAVSRPTINLPAQWVDCTED